MADERIPGGTPGGSPSGTPGGDRLDGGLRVVVTGATGNIGTSVVQALGEDPKVESVLGLARRIPDWAPPKTTWARADLGKDDPQTLAGHLQDADVLIHLAWLFHPARDPVATWRTNVLGSESLYRAAAAAGVRALVQASSVGAYSPGPKDRLVDEDWPTHGWPEAAYCREKAYVERLLDTFERENPLIRVVRMRPGIVVKKESASEQRRIFAGPLLLRALVRPDLLPVVPDVPGLRFQCLHTSDVAEAFRLAATTPVSGPFNLAAAPVVDAHLLAGMFHARAVSVPRRPVRGAAAAAWRLRLVPVPPTMLEAAMQFPLMDSGRAGYVLGWRPRYSSTEAISEFLEGLRQGAGMRTPPLEGRLPRGGRLREAMTGVGRRA